MGRDPCMIGTGTMSTAPRENGPHDFVEDDLGDSAALRGVLIEDVRKRSSQIAFGPRVRVARDGFLLQSIESTHLVESEDVIRVAVREQDRVETADAKRQRLRTQVGRRIDENPPDPRRDRRCRSAIARCSRLRQIDQHRRAHPAIARIGRSAHVAVAADHRHAVRRACAEQGDRKATAQ